ncbi:DedA family protein [Vibrio sp. S4M6]|uniref:DedA family protein n=1 Tax=Vibrio sinus TaxID=2946865 RepID=UPI002029D7C9|nr:DedA family protein [Vibrio sinus]
MSLVTQLHQYLISTPHSWYFLAAGVILLSYLLEDLAIITAATLATQGLMSVPVALVAIFIGIATGDLALYYLGKYCQHFRGIKYRALTNQYFRVLRKKFRQNAFLNIFIIRFVPGLRSVGFTLSGFFSIPLTTFILAVLFATSLWTLLVFSTIYYLGMTSWIQSSQYHWMIIPIALFVLFVVNRVVNKSFARGYS